MKLQDFLSKKCIVPDIASSNKPDLISELAEQIGKVHPDVNTAKTAEVLMERENISSFAVDNGVALPHGKISGITEALSAFGRSREGVFFNSVDNAPSHLFFLILTPENSSGIQNEILSRFSKIVKDPSVRARLMESSSPEEMYSILLEEDEKLH